MAQLIVRNIEESVVRKLKKVAGEHGISVEEEHRRILRDALSNNTRGKISFKQALSEMPKAGSDSDFERVRDNGRDIEL